MKTYQIKNRHSQRSRSLILDDPTLLNDQQRAVVTAGSGPLLVIAGAGSGKTHTLTYRMAYLIDQGVAPERILLLTFTNRAAREMTSRAAKLIQLDNRRLWSGTFHSIANRILRREAQHLGYPKDFTILDSDDSTTLMKACIADLQGELPRRRLPSEKSLHRIYSMRVNTFKPLEDIITENFPYFDIDIDSLNVIFNHYSARKHAMGVMDFDDLLMNWHKLLTNDDTMRIKYASQFEHILVDEYQDTNQLQGRIIDLMASVHTNLMVVGDDCQSIYAFRGADYSNILEFPQRHPQCKQFLLETNYRSTPEIITLANQSIRHNPKQFQKTLHAARDNGMQPVVVRVNDSTQQAKFICERIIDLMDEGVELNEIAVLYRAHYQSMELQVEMARYNIPFMVRSGLRFFEQAHTKDILAYLRFIFNPRDELAFMRLIKQWPGIGNKRAQSIWTYLQSLEDISTAFTRADNDALPMPSRANQSWIIVKQLLGSMFKQRLTTTADIMIDNILAAGYLNYIKQNYDNPDNRLADIEQLATYAGQFDSLDRFLGEVALLSGVAGQEIVVGEYDEQQFVCLTSIHQAKGLEWKACFILSLSDGEFPSKNAHTEEDMAEERRLFYVATTRAKDELYLCQPLTRLGRDYFTVVLRESPFISELSTIPYPFVEWKIESGI